MLYSNTSHASIDTSWLALRSWLTRLCMFRMAEELRQRRKRVSERGSGKVCSRKRVPGRQVKKNNWRSWRRTRYNPTLNFVQYFQDCNRGLRVDISQLHVQYMRPCAMLFTGFHLWRWGPFVVRCLFWYRLWFYFWLWFTDCRLFPIDLLWYIQELWAQDEFLFRDNKVYCIVLVIKPYTAACRERCANGRGAVLPLTRQWIVKRILTQAF